MAELGRGGAGHGGHNHAGHPRHGGHRGQPERDAALSLEELSEKLQEEARVDWWRALLDGVLMLGVVVGYCAAAVLMLKMLGQWMGWWK